TCTNLSAGWRVAPGRVVGRTGQSLLICALGWNRSYLIALVRPITRRARKGGCNWLKQGLAGRIRQLRLKENDAAVARFVRGPETLFEEIGGQAVLCNTTVPRHNPKRTRSSACSRVP